MKLAPSQAKVLAEALRALAGGDGRRFDDALWLGLGDGCAQAYKALTRNGCIENAHDLQEIRITSKGRTLLQRLTESVLLVA
jgi:hypothetical protein